MGSKTKNVPRLPAIPHAFSTLATSNLLAEFSNPIPEIMPEEAKIGGAMVVGSGRSDYPNQINNVLAFPGIFRGALESGAKHITEKMKIAAAEAIAGCVKTEELSTEKIVPSPFDKEVVKKVAKAIGSLVNIDPIESQVNQSNIMVEAVLS